jgi:hypothetical protein
MMAQSGIHVYVASKARPTKIALWRALSGAGLPVSVCDRLAASLFGMTIQTRLAISSSAPTR